MRFGKTIKKIRIEKGLTQKNVSEGIVTLSYYSRIERDISEPTISVFLKILHRLNLAFDEFMFIHNNYRESLDDELWFTLTELYHTGNIQALKKHKKLLLYQSNGDTFLVDLIDLFILRLSKQKIEPINTKSIVKHLMNIENWTSSEVKLFTTIMDMLPVDTIIIMVNHLLKRRNLYMRSKGYNSPYSKILINSIIICIDTNHLKEAEVYLSELKNMFETRDFYGRSMYKYLKGLLLALLENKELGEKEVFEFFSICEFLELDSFAEKYRTFYYEIINN
ncbi:helix-turn-helix domain-containing protein [Enterococcus faecalis]|nr:helix-turn-helix domain-containing protein [Enterococcus faecalis]